MAGLEKGDSTQSAKKREAHGKFLGNVDALRAVAPKACDRSASAGPRYDPGTHKDGSTRSAELPLGQGDSATIQQTPTVEATTQPATRRGEPSDAANVKKCGSNQLAQKLAEIIRLLPGIGPGSQVWRRVLEEFARSLPRPGAIEVSPSKVATGQMDMQKTPK